MKILILLDDFPPITYTGASIVAYNLAQGLLKKGHNVFIITSVQGRLKEGEEEYDGLKIFRVYTNYHERWQSYLSLYNPQVVSKIDKIIKKIKPDVCHFHHIHRYLSYHCFKIAKKYCSAVFLTAHDMMLFNYGKVMPKNGNCIYKMSIKNQISQVKRRYNPFRNIIIRYYLKYIDKIFSISDFLKKSLRINGIKNTVIIHNAIEINDWQFDFKKVEKFKINYNLENKKIILFGGRLSEAKGGEAILKTMKLVTKDMKKVILLVIGRENQYTQKMIQLSKDFNIDNNVKFTNWLNRDTMKGAFFSSDVCVTPSVYGDPFNLFNIEAGAAKKPVVGTCFGGTPEIIIDNKTGYIVNPLNTELMAKKIIYLLKNSRKAKQFGEAGYQRIKNNFSIEGQVEKTLDWYKKFL